MKIAFIGDNHLADRNSTDPFTLEKRIHIINHDDFDNNLIDYLNSSGADHFVMLGDLVDWYSVENVQAGAHFLSRLNKPWHVTPGNHDYQLDLRLRPKFNDGKVHEWADETPLICKKHALADWDKNGIELRSRKLELGNINLYLIDSATGTISIEDQEWIMKDLAANNRSFNVVATHVPFPCTPLDKKFTETNKTSDVYIQVGLIDGFEESLLENVDKVYCGHVHFKEIRQTAKTEFNMVSLATKHSEEEKFDSVSLLEC